MENVCLAVNEIRDFYAVGSKSHVTFVDGRTVYPVNSVMSPTFGSGEFTSPPFVLSPFDHHKIVRSKSAFMFVDLTLCMTFLIIVSMIQDNYVKWPCIFLIQVGSACLFLMYELIFDTFLLHVFFMFQEFGQCPSKMT